ncbi:hypothetical protein J3R82DRAFT_9104 [Butyriboletus roseoflavus]|nr:hypothetical protein J3R82DRAFT_9104 [Butyriboletus roseoflavus]
MLSYLNSLTITDSLHAGKTKKGWNFASVYIGFDTTVIEAYGRFLAEVFCDEESEYDTMQGCEEGTPSNDNDS